MVVPSDWSNIYRIDGFLLSKWHHEVSVSRRVSINGFGFVGTTGWPSVGSEERFARDTKTFVIPNTCRYFLVDHTNTVSRTSWHISFPIQRVVSHRSERLGFAPGCLGRLGFRTRLRWELWYPQQILRRTLPGRFERILQTDHFLHHHHPAWYSSCNCCSRSLKNRSLAEANEPETVVATEQKKHCNCDCNCDCDCCFWESKTKTNVWLWLWWLWLTLDFLFFVCGDEKIHFLFVVSPCSSSSSSCHRPSEKKFDSTTNKKEKWNGIRWDGM